MARKPATAAPAPKAPTAKAAPTYPRRLKGWTAKRASASITVEGMDVDTKQRVKVVKVSEIIGAPRSREYPVALIQTEGKPDVRIELA